MFKGVAPGGRSRALRPEPARKGITAKAESITPVEGVRLNNAFPACKDFLLLGNLEHKETLRIGRGKNGGGVAFAVCLVLFSFELQPEQVPAW